MKPCPRLLVGLYMLATPAFAQDSEPAEPLPEPVPPPSSETGALPDAGIQPPVETETPEAPPETVPPPKPLAPKGPAVKGKQKLNKVAPKGKAVKGKVKTVRKAKRKETSNSLIDRRGQNSPVVVGEAQLLPAQVLRFRYIFKSFDGSTGFDKDGKKTDSGASLSATGHALTAEYGITDNWSLQLLMPFVGTNDLTIQAAKFRKSQAYEREYQKIVETVAPALIAQGMCTDLADCRTRIDNGLALGVATPVELSTGEVTTVPANVPIRAAADSLILNGVRPESGKAGLGDIQVAIGYNVYSSPLQLFTVALGARFPTGEFGEVPTAYRPPGAGFFAGGLALKYDLRLMPFMISFSNQTEYALAKAERKRSSLLRPLTFNQADSTDDDPNIPGAGDGFSNIYSIERKGLYHIGFTRFAYSLGGLADILKPVAIYAYYNWTLDPEYHYQGGLYREASQLTSASAAFSIDGLALQPSIPVSFTYMYDTPMSGKNVAIAPNSHLFQFNLYYKF